MTTTEEYPVAQEVVLESTIKIDSATRAKIHLGLLNQLVDVRKGVVDLPGCAVRLRVLRASPSGHSPEGDHYLYVTSKTTLRFTDTCAASVVFSLDLSPSMNVVDTSFKGFNTGCYLVESLEVAVRLALEALLFSGREKVYVTVVAQGVPELGMKTLVLGEKMTDRISITHILRQVQTGLYEALDELAAWLQKNHEEEQVGAKMNCSRTRLPCISEVCKENDVSELIRNCLLAGSAATAKIPSCLGASISSSVVLVTDGVLFHPRRLQYDNILMQLNVLDCGLHVIQVGGGFAPWSALGFVSDPDLIRMLASSTPNGLYVQDHHISSMLYRGNPLEHALLTRTSPVTVNPKHERMHIADSKLSYQSSLVVVAKLPESPSSSSLTHTHTHKHCTYVEHLKLLGVKRSEPIVIQGLLVPPPSPGASSPGMPRRKNSFETLLDQEADDQDASFGDSNVSQYYQSSSEKFNKARPFLFKTYLLPGVSLGKLLECRVREGFVVEAVSEKEGQSVRLSLPWGVTMEVIYEVVCSAGDQELRIKIHLRMPSGAFFLKFKQAASSQLPPPTAAPPAAGGAGAQPNPPKRSSSHNINSIDCSQTAATNFVQLCRQLDAFIEGIFSVDDALAKMHISSDLLLATDADLWHRWLSVQSLYLVLSTSSTSTSTGRGGGDFAVAGDLVVRGLASWASSGSCGRAKQSQVTKFVKEFPSREDCSNTVLMAKFFGHRLSPAGKARAAKNTRSLKVYVDASLRSSSSGVFRVTVGFDGLDESAYQTVLTDMVAAVNEQLLAQTQSSIHGHSHTCAAFLQTPVSLRSLVAKPAKTPFALQTDGAIPCEFSLARWLPSREFADKVVSSVQGDRSLEDSNALQGFIRRRLSEGWRKVFEQDGTLCLVNLLDVPSTSDALAGLPEYLPEDDLASTDDEKEPVHDVTSEDDVTVVTDIRIDWPQPQPRPHAHAHAARARSVAKAACAALVLTLHYLPASHRHGSSVTYTLAVDGACAARPEVLKAVDRRLWSLEELDKDEFAELLGLGVSAAAAFQSTSVAESLVLGPGVSVELQLGPDGSKSAGIELRGVQAVPAALDVTLEVIGLDACRRTVGRVRAVTGDGCVLWPREARPLKVKLRNNGLWTCAIAGLFNIARCFLLCFRSSNK